MFLKQTLKKDSVYVVFGVFFQQTGIRTVKGCQNAPQQRGKGQIFKLRFSNSELPPVKRVGGLADVQAAPQRILGGLPNIPCSCVHLRVVSASVKGCSAETRSSDSPPPPHEHPLASFHHPTQRPLKGGVISRRTINLSPALILAQVLTF